MVPFLGRLIRLIGPFGGLPFIGKEFLRRKGDPFILFLVINIVIQEVNLFNLTDSGGITV